MERTNGAIGMSDIDDRTEAQEAEYEMGIEREIEQAELDAERLFCKGCGNELLAENCWMDDGCQCNMPRGVNYGNQQISEWRREREQRASHEVERLRQQIKGVQGALADAGDVLCFREDGDYGSSVREAVEQRDAARQQIAAAQGEVERLRESELHRQFDFVCREHGGFRGHNRICPRCGKVGSVLAEMPDPWTEIAVIRTRAESAEAALAAATEAQAKAAQVVVGGPDTILDRGWWAIWRCGYWADIRHVGETSFRGTFEGDTYLRLSDHHPLTAEQAAREHLAAKARGE